MKEIKGFIYREIGTTESKIKFSGEPKVGYELKILDKSQKEIREYDYITPTDNTVEIILKVGWENKTHSEVRAEDIEYDLPKSDAWDITNGAIRIKKKPEYEQKIKEAHKKLLKERQPQLFNINEKREHDSTNIEFNITGEGGKMQITFYKKGATDLTPRAFSEDRINIKPKYYVTREITHPEGGDITEEKPDKFRLTKGWIIFFVFLAVALLLVVVFWKKIWKWIRGEREQEKKVKEQLDIF